MWGLAAKGLMLSQAWGEERDTAKGIELLKRAASMSHIYAMHVLGLIHINGSAVLVDHAEARRWFTMAANRKSPEDIYNLGLMDWQGLAIPKPDRQRAMERFQEAAAMGEKRATSAVAAGHP